MFKRRQRDPAEEQAESVRQQQFHKLCQLCSPNFSKDEVLASEIDWEVVWRLALRHRVVPVMADRIKQLAIPVPDEYAKLIAENVQQNLYKGMKQAAELVRLTKLFEEHGIPFVVFKGIALLKLMGLELHQRHHGDIDILLADVGDVWRADELLTKQMGYVEVRPKRLIKFNRSQQAHFFSFDKDVGYFNKNKGISIELHFKILPSKAMLPFSSENAYASRQMVDLNSVQVPVLSLEKHQLYLLLHGSISRWFRLKWLCDVPLSSFNGQAYLYNDSAVFHHQNFDRMVCQSLYLAHEYLVMPLSAFAKQRFQKNVKAVFLAKVSAYFLDNERTLAEQRPKSLFEIIKYYSWLLRYKFSLMNSWCYKRDVVRQYSTDEHDWKAVNLAEDLFFLYYPLRPFLWLKRQF